MYRHLSTHFRILLLIFIISACSYPALAGGAGTAFGDFGDSGLTPFSEPGKVVQNTAPDPVLNPSTSNQTKNITGQPKANETVNTSPGEIVANQTRNLTINATANATNLNETQKKPSLGDLIRAGDLNAVTNFQAEKRQNLTGALGVNPTAEKLIQQDQKNELEGGYVFTVQAPCTS